MSKDDNLTSDLMIAAASKKLSRNALKEAAVASVRISRFISSTMDVSFHSALQRENAKLENAKLENKIAHNLANQMNYFDKSSTVESENSNKSTEIIDESSDERVDQGSSYELCDQVMLDEQLPLQSYNSKNIESICDTSKNGHRQRMRAKVINGDVSSMHNYELIEMLIFLAQPRGDHRTTAKVLMKEFKSIGGILGADLSQIKKIKGVGESTACAIKLIFEIFGRVAREEISSTPVLSTNEKVINYCKITMANLPREHFRILFLNKKNFLIADEVQQVGTIDQTPIYPREVVKRAIELNAGALIMIHNHPTGDASPSPADIYITRQIKNALSTIDVKLHDHIVIGKFGHVSMKSMGLV